MFQKSGVISGGAYDLQRKAQRWEEKEVTGLRQERDQFGVIKLNVIFRLVDFLYTLM